MSTTYQTIPAEPKAEGSSGQINLQPGERYDGAPASASPPQNLHFLWTTLAVFLMLYLLPWFLIRASGTERSMGSIYGALMNYGYDTARGNDQ